MLLSRIKGWNIIHRSFLDNNSATKLLFTSIFLYDILIGKYEKRGIKWSLTNASGT